MSHVDDGFRSLTLKRFPQTDDVNPLLAWEAADEYLAIVRRRITICWRISKRFPMTPKFLTWPGATWRSSGVAIYVM
ncbi:hypothetical protein MJI47_27975, partial [Salmonella enterica subsp. enterica serovar Kentucky]|nr:hypothetical protein [Salmonella enterica subsp. enterica serovar Kentucky]